MENTFVELQEGQTIYVDGEVRIIEIKGVLYAVHRKTVAGSITTDKRFNHYCNEVSYFCSVWRDSKNCWYDLYYSYPDDTILGFYNNQGDYLSGVERIPEFDFCKEEVDQYLEFIRSLLQE